MKVGPYITPLTEINPKWNKDLNIRLDIIKLSEENIGKKLICYIGLSNDVLAMTPQAQITKAKDQEMRLHQTQKLLHSRRI